MDDSTVDVPTITMDEENILRYAAGYIPFKLLKYYETKSSESTVGIIECLSALAVNGEESSLLEYTRKWIWLLNRGGLFEVNDTAYTFFKEIEMKIRRKLFASFNVQAVDQDQKEYIINSVSSDDNVQFFQ